MAVKDDDPESVITPGSTWSTCKDCGKRYAYSTASIRAERVARVSAPERCRKCAQLHRKEIDAVGVAHFAARARDGGPVPLGISTGRLGKIHHDPRVHTEIRPNPIIDEEIKKAGVTDENLDDLFRALSTHQVVLVEGGTGSGKSTYVPCRLVEPGTDERRALWMPRGPVVITQPRRQATAAIPKRVAGLLGCGVGPRMDVGYRYGGVNESDLTRNRIVFMTDGVLLNWLLEGAMLDQIAAVVIDEAHERSVRIDVILALMRRILPRFPQLKLVIASATIDTAKFRSFFGDAAADDETDPEQSILEATVPAIRCKSQTSGYELHHRSEGEDARPPLKVYDQMIKSGQGVVGVPKREITRALVEEIVGLLKEAPAETDDILGFLSSMAEVDNACQRIRDIIEDDPRMSHVDVLPLYRQLTEEQRAAATERKVDPGRRRVIVATNIAETSLTIEELNYVVDSGLIVQPTWSDDEESADYPSVLHSQAGCLQRWGRVGRVRPGKVRTLYTEEQFKKFAGYTAPEIERTALDDLVMQVKLAGFEPAELEWLSKPVMDMVSAAAARLERGGALAAEGHVTSFGAEMNQLGLSPNHARLMIEADRYACSIEMATWLAMQGRSSLFANYRNLDAVSRARAARAHEALRGGARDDLDYFLKLFAGWKGEFEAGEAHDARAWSQSWFVHHETLLEIEQKREDHLKGFSRHGKEDERRAIDLSLIDRVRELIYRYSDRDRYKADGDSFVSFKGERAILSNMSCVRPGAAEIVVFELNKGRNNPPKIHRAIISPPPGTRVGEGVIDTALEMRASTRNDVGDLLADVPSHWLVLAIEQIAPPSARFTVAPVQGTDWYRLGAIVATAPLMADRRAETQPDPTTGGTPDDDGPPLRNAAVFASDSGDPPSAVLATEDPRDEDRDDDSGTTPHRQVRLLDAMWTALRAGPAVGVDAASVMEVAGYDRTAEGGPVVLLRPASASFSDATLGLNAGDEIIVEAVSVLDDPNEQGEDVLVTRHIASGLEVFIDREDVNLDASPAALRLIPAGARIVATVLSVDSAREQLHVTMLPALIRHREQALAEGRGTFPARIIGKDSGRKRAWCDAVIDELSAPDAGHIVTARLKVDARGFNTYRIGDQLYVAVQPQDGSMEFPATTVEIDFPAIHPSLHLDLGNGRLTFKGRMAADQYHEMSRRTSSRVVRDALHKLLRGSNRYRPEVVDLENDAALRERYPVGTDIDVTIRKIEATGLLVDLPDGGGVQRIHRPALDWDQEIAVSSIGRAGDVLRVRVVGDERRVRLSRKALQPDPRAALAAIAGTDTVIETKITAIQHELGLSLRLPGGVSGFVPWREVPDGNHDAVTRFSPGQAFPVRVLSVEGPRGKVLVTGHVDRPAPPLEPAPRPAGPRPRQPAPQRLPREAVAAVQGVVRALPIASYVQVHQDDEKFRGLATLIACDREVPPTRAELDALRRALGGDVFWCVRWSDDPVQLLRNVMAYYGERDIVRKVDWGANPDGTLTGYVTVDDDMIGHAWGKGHLRARLAATLLGAARIVVRGVSQR